MTLVIVGVAFVLSGLACFVLSKGEVDPLRAGALGGLVALVVTGLRVSLGWGL